MVRYNSRVRRYILRYGFPETTGSRIKATAIRKGNNARHTRNKRKSNTTRNITRKGIERVDMDYLASDALGGVALYNPSTGVYSSSPNPRSPNTIALLESKIAEGFRPITDFDTTEGKVHLQYFMEKSNQPASMLKRESILMIRKE